MLSVLKQAKKMNNPYTYPHLDALQDKEKWDIPKNYFEELLPRILAKIAAEKINESVEEKYFDTFFSRLKGRIEEEEMELDTPMLDSISKDNLWQVPEGYFDTFAAKIQENVAEKAIYPLLFSVEKPSVEAPDGYFEALPAHISAKIQQGEKGEVLTFAPSWAKRVRNYGITIAASIALILGGMWLMPEKTTPTNDANFAPNFSHISTQELQEAIDAEDIDDALLAQVISVNYTPATQTDLPQVDDISEEELLQYLEKEGEL